MKRKTDNMNILLVKIGQKIAGLRKLKGYDRHEEFAGACDFPAVLYWKLEKGKTNFTIKTLSKILSVHNLSLEQFFVSLGNVKSHEETGAA